MPIGIYTQIQQVDSLNEKKDTKNILNIPLLLRQRVTI
jgi:hypothetical protein